MQHSRISLLIFGLLLLAIQAFGQCPGPSQRQALLNLQRALEVEDTRAGQIPLTDTCGNQRYAQYVEVNLDTIAYIPTPTGNTQNLSEFVITTTGRLFYIDWQGNSVEFAGGGGSCDVDFLQISDNSCPDQLTDSIYKYNYVSIGGRNVWPGAELQVADSSDIAIEVINGFRGARVVLYNNNTELWSTLSQEGSGFSHYIVPDGVFTWLTAGGGTPEAPNIPEIKHFGVNTNDSTIQMYQYPRTRVDTQAVVNFLYTDPVGKVRSQAASAFPLAGLGGIYSGSGIIPDGTDATLVSAFSTFIFNYFGGADAHVFDANGNYLYSPNGLCGVDVTNNLVQFYNTGGGQFYSTNTDAGFNGSFLNILHSSGGAAELRFNEPIASGANYSAFKAQAQAGNVTYTLPAADGSSGNVLSTNGSGTLSWAAAGGSGTVTSFSSGNLSPLFTTSVATATTTPALSFTLDNQTANTVFAGPTSGGAAAPTFRALVAADIPSSAAGAFFKDGGNSFGAAATLGTNDNNSLSFETNNVTRATVTSGASTGGAWTCTDVTANTNTVEDIYTLQANSTGTPAAGFGTAILFQGESSTTDNRDMARISADWVIETDASRAAEIKFGTGAGGGAITNFATFRRTGASAGEFLLGSSSILTLRNSQFIATTPYTMGAGTSAFTIGQGTGALNFSRNTATTNAPVSFNIAANSTGTPANGLGPQLLLQGESSTTTDQDMAGISSIWTDVTHATRTADIIFSTVNNAAALAEKMRLTAAGRLGILDTSPETELDVTGTTATGHLIGQDNTPTITVDAAGAGTGASASMVNAQSSDLAGRFSITSGTGATTGRWASISFGTTFTVTPVVTITCEDADCAGILVGWYVNVSTSGFEIFCVGTPSDSTTHEYAFHITGGK